MQDRVKVDASNLWLIAQRQMAKLKPQNPMVLNNISSQQKLSIQSVFKKVNNKQLTSILPKGIYNITQNKQQVPQSVKFLDFYAQKMGFLKMGQIYQNQGNRYIGRIQQISKEGQKFYKPFPNFQNKRSIQTPNLQQNLSFKATNAIQKWNQFVKAQAQLAQFLNNVSTPQGRKQQILSLAKSSSTGTDQLRILASIFFLYFDQKSSNTNYFGITDIQRLKNLIEVKDKGLEVTYNNVNQYIQTNATKNYQVISGFHQYKVQSIRQSISAQQYNMIKPFLDDKKAFVPKQMIQQTINDSQWFQIFNKNEQKSSSSLVITIWPYGQRWFRPHNYLY